MASTWTWPAGVQLENPLPVFTPSPNWANGITEQLSWLTDVIESEQAVEQRRQLRVYPRRTFEAGFLRADIHRARLDNFASGIGRRPFLFPLWHEQFRLGDSDDDVPGLVRFPAGTLAKREFGIDVLVLVIDRDPNVFSVLQVTAIYEDDSLQLRAVTGDAGIWNAGCRIVPLRKAVMYDQLSLDNPTSRAATATFRFQLVDPEDRFVPSWGYCSPLWRTKPDRATSLQLDFERSYFTLDNDVGPIDTVDLSKRTKVRQQMAVKFFGRDKVWAFRSFLYAARGRLKRFYVPSYLNDLEPATTFVSGMQMDVKPSGFTDFQDVPQEARRIIGIEFLDGRPALYRNIVGISPVLSVVAPARPVAERFELDVALPTISASDIARINFVVPSRFDQDTVEIFHHVDDSAACSVAVVTVSSIVAGMPPIDCWISSRPYPVVDVEQMQSSAMITAGRLYDASQNQTEMMQSAALLTTGSLRTTLLNKDIGFDEMRSSMSLTAATLRQVLRSYDRYEFESTQSNMTFVSGTLKAILINKTLPFESVTSSAIITQGTLT